MSKVRHEVSERQVAANKRSVWAPGSEAEEAEADSEKSKTGCSEGVSAEQRGQNGQTKPS